MYKTRVLVTVRGGINMQKATDYINRWVNLVYGRSVLYTHRQVKFTIQRCWNHMAKVCEKFS